MGMQLKVVAFWVATALIACAGAPSKPPKPVNGRPVDLAYVKASNTNPGDLFGYGIALSADGSTLAVGAHFEASAAAGLDGDQADNSIPEAGAVYVFTRNGMTWEQQAYLKASYPGRNHFGLTVALSADGSTLAVGADFESSMATGIDGNQADNSRAGAGAVYVFTRSGVTWSQQAYVKASNTDTETGDGFGWSVALSADGSTLAVGAVLEYSAATGIDGDQADNSAPSAGAVYVFTRSGAMWSQQAYVKASNTGTRDFFGYSIALSADGSTLAVGSHGESSAATGIDGNQADNSAFVAGAVYVFTRSGAMWSQQAYVKASNTGTGDHFGHSVALSTDGSTLAVGASYAARGPGLAYVFTRSGTMWSQQAYVNAPGTGPGTYFGVSVALSADGSTLAVGAYGEASSATGIDGTNDSRATGAGAVYTFTRSGTMWSQQAYVKASNTGVHDHFGWSVSLAADASTLVVGAPQERSSATGIGGNQTNRAAENAGAVYVLPWPS